MKQLLINQCSDSRMWYAHLVGKTVPFLKEVEDGFLSREPAGFTNIVQREDAEIVERKYEP